MKVTTVSTFFSLGAVVIAGFVVIAVALGLAARFSERARAGWNLAVESLGGSAVRVAWLVAVAATLGSLYYSEIAHFEPCRFCWYQRIAMYPLSLILGVGAFTRDRTVYRYGIPMASVGGLIAGYHYLIQHVPSLSTGACSISVPCSAAYVWKFDFVSIPFMALVSFAAIVVLLVMDRAQHRRDSATTG